MTPPDLPPLVVPTDGGWLLGSYDTDELDAIAVAEDDDE